MPTTKAQKRGVFLYVGGETFDFWESYHVHNDLLDATGGFHLRAPLKPDLNTRELLVYRNLHPGARVDLRVTTADGKVTPQLTGRIDTVETVEDIDGGSILEVSGRSHTWKLLDADLIPSISMDGVTYADVLRRVLALFGYSSTQLVVANDANRVLETGKAAAGVTLSKDAPTDLKALKIEQAMPHPGESPWAFLSRHAKRLGLLLWGTADGQIVASRPAYEQKPLCRLAMLRGPAGQGNNVKTFGRRLSVMGQPSEVHVYGKSANHDFAASSVHAIVMNPAVTEYVPMTLQDHTVADKTQAERRAKYELSLRTQGADVITARCAGHLGSGGAVFSIDTIADVQWDAGSIHGPMYIIRRSLDGNRAEAESTSLELVQKGSIALG